MFCLLIVVKFINYLLIYGNCCFGMFLDFERILAFLYTNYGIVLTSKIQIIKKKILFLVMLNTCAESSRLI